MAGGLIPIAEARRAVLERVRPVEAESVPVAEALGRVLAEPVASTEDVPGFDNSAMDGYAVRAQDTAGAPVELDLAGESSAGHPWAGTVNSGDAIAISTGAAVPEGADAVVRVEDTEREGGRVRVLVDVERGRDIRRAGEDIVAGRELLARGTQLGPAELGVLVSAGVSDPRCARRPRLAMVATGDELIGPGDEMRPGAVRNSNAYTVPSLAELAGAEVVAAERVGDDPAATREALARALEAADVVVVCGGVSVGPHDHVRPAFAELGVDERFWGVALRPGKPTWFGGGDGAPLAFGLPGNPVSAYVTFVLFVRPAIAALQGSDPSASRGIASLAEPFPRMKRRDQVLRCALEASERGWLARPTGHQGSHVLTSMLGADALATIEAGEGEAAAGERIEVEFLRLPGNNVAGRARA